MYFWYFHSMKHLNCHSASFLIGVRRALPARSQREKGDRRVFTCWSAQAKQNTTWSKTVFPLTSQKSILPWWAWSGADKKTDGLNIPCPRSSPEKPICTHLYIPLLLAWQFWGGQECHSRWDTSLGRAEHEHKKTKFFLLKIPWQLHGNNFPQDGMDTTS